MKQLCALLLTALLLVGCSDNADNATPVAGVSQNDREKYTKLVDETLYNTYWRYSRESMEFFNANVPPNNDENVDMFTASANMGLSLDIYAGKPADTATVDLLHYNGEPAGRAYFYFNANALAGVYYSGGYDGGYHSLNERNLFLADSGFKKFEAGKPEEGSFLSKKFTFLPDGFVSAAQNSKNQLLLASLELGNVVIYNCNDISLKRQRTIYLNNNGDEAVSAALTPEGLAVLISNLSEHEFPTEGEHLPITSKKVMFYNQSFNLSTQMELTAPNYTAVAYDNGQLVLSKGDTLEYYNYTNNGYELDKQYFLGHGVLAMHIADLDADGVMEYIFTDEQDLYLYHKNDKGFVKLWSTHLGIPSISGSIYSGDLNQDGVKEIYVSDITGTMIRYVLTPTGLRSSNGDVEYGDRIYPLDINNDGLDDYVRLNNVEGLQSMLYTARIPEVENDEQ